MTALSRPAAHNWGMGFSFSNEPLPPQTAGAVRAFAFAVGMDPSLFTQEAAQRDREAFSQNVEALWAKLTAGAPATAAAVGCALQSLPSANDCYHPLDVFFSPRKAVAVERECSDVFERYAASPFGRTDRDAPSPGQAREFAVWAGREYILSTLFRDLAGSTAHSWADTASERLGHLARATHGWSLAYPELGAGGRTSQSLVRSVTKWANSGQDQDLSDAFDGLRDFLVSPEASGVVSRVINFTGGSVGAGFFAYSDTRALLTPDEFEQMLAATPPRALTDRMRLAARRSFATEAIGRVVMDPTPKSLDRLNGMFPDDQRIASRFEALLVGSLRGGVIDYAKPFPEEAKENLWAERLGTLAVAEERLVPRAYCLREVAAWQSKLAQANPPHQSWLKFADALGALAVERVLTTARDEVAVMTDDAEPPVKAAERLLKACSEIAGTAPGAPAAKRVALGLYMERIRSGEMEGYSTASFRSNSHLVAATGIALGWAEECGPASAPEAAALREVIGRSVSECSRLSGESVAYLAAHHEEDAGEILAARLMAHVTHVASHVGSAEDVELAERASASIRGTKGVHYILQRCLAQLESHRVRDPESLLALVRKFDSGGTHNGTEKEVRALFANYDRLARLNLPAGASFVPGRQPDVREVARRKLAESRQLQRASYLQMLADAPNLREARTVIEQDALSRSAGRVRAMLAPTGRSASAVELDMDGLGEAQKQLLNDAQEAQNILRTYRAPEAAEELGRVMQAYAAGEFAALKQDRTHPLLATLSRPAQDSWFGQDSWQTTVDGKTYRMRETIDPQDTFYYAERPVQTCNSVLGFGMHLTAGITLLGAPHQKLLVVEDEKGRAIGRSVLRLAEDEQGGRCLIAEGFYGQQAGGVELGLRDAMATALDGKYGAVGVNLVLGSKHGERNFTSEGTGTPYGARRNVSMRHYPGPAGHEYYDSSAPVTYTDERAVQMALMQDWRAPVAARQPRVSPTSTSIQHFPPLAQTLSVKDAAQRASGWLFEHGGQQSAFLANGGDLAKVSGPLPPASPSDKRRWRDAVIQNPKIGEYLHLGASLQARLSGPPAPAKGGEDVRLAVATTLARPLLKSVLPGRSRHEIGVLREALDSLVAERVAARPEIWSVDIEAKQLVELVVERAQKALRPVQAPGFTTDTPSPPGLAALPNLPVPTPATTPVMTPAL